jgi:hypothetical protein
MAIRPSTRTHTFSFVRGRTKEYDKLNKSSNSNIDMVSDDACVQDQHVQGVDEAIKTVLEF